MSDSYVTKGELPGQARPKAPGHDCEAEMYAKMGMRPPPHPGAPHGPGQATSYKVPVVHKARMHKA